MKNKKPIIFMVLLLVACFTIGGTIAYYTTSDTFNNEFNTLTYDIETQENFVSPDNWTPGTTTPKTVIANNKGTTPAAVRVKLTPSWVDKDGNPLSLTDSNDNNVAIINFNNDYTKKWVYQDGYYYYKRALNENQSTTSLLKSITFNPNAEIDKTKNCETVNGITTCRTTYNDYSGGTYTLQVEVETCQYDQYQEIWNTNVSLKAPILADGILTNNESTLVNNLDKNSFESITILDSVSVPTNAIGSWDVSSEQNGSIMAWYLDADNDEKYELYIGQEDGVKANPDSSYVFSSFNNAELIDVTNLDTSNVINMSGMFQYAGSNAESISIVGLNNLDTRNVTNMYYMFYYAGRYSGTIDIGDISNWNTSNVINMSGVFYMTGWNAATFNIDVSNWDTSSVTNMSRMFDRAGRSASTWSIGNLSNWDVSSVTMMDNMFYQAGYYADTWGVGDLSNWDTSNVWDMSYMFTNAGYRADTWNSIGTLKVNATLIVSMFYDCPNAQATLNIYSNPTSYSSTFYNAARYDGSGITVNYSSATTDIDNIIATKSSNSNVVKGSQLD